MTGRRGDGEMGRHLPVTPSPHHPVTPSPHHPVSPSALSPHQVRGVELAIDAVVGHHLLHVSLRLIKPDL